MSWTNWVLLDKLAEDEEVGRSNGMSQTALYSYFDRSSIALSVAGLAGRARG